MKMRWKKLVGLFLLGGFFLFAIISCSTGKHILGWSNIFGSREAKIDGFLSNVRPQPGNPDSHYLLACYYQERGRHREALEEFKKTLMIDPSYVKAYNGMGVSFDLMGDFSRAIESYKTALQMNPGLDYVHNNMGYSYLLQGNFDEAVTAFQKAITLNDKEKRFHNNLGLAYAEKGEFHLALSAFLIAGDETKAHLNLANIHFKKGFFEEAQKHYSIALGLNPAHTVARTAIKAADSLARIFEPENKKPMPKALVLPEQPVILPSPSIDSTVTSLREKETTEAHPKMSFRGSGMTEAISQIIDNPEIAALSRYARNARNGENGMATVNIKREESATLFQLTGLKVEEVPAPNYLNDLEELVIHKQYPQKKNVNSLKNIDIEISNGNGVRRMAQNVGEYLKEKGFRVTRLTNDVHFNHTGTKIIYQREYEKAADHISEHLPVCRAKEEAERLHRPNIKVKVLIGKDLIPHQKKFINGKT